MVALLAALFLAAPGIQGKSLLQQVVPHPTGKNGYEEYLKAAEIVGQPNALLFLTWSPGQSETWKPDSDVPGDTDRYELALRLEKMSLLEVRREALQRYGEALAWVRQGNTKPVFDPRGEIDAITLFPELARFRYLARLATAAAYVYDADGTPTKATEVLLDSLTMSGNIEHTTLISYLVGVACKSIVLASFQSRLDQLSEVDAKRVALAVSEPLARPSGMLDAMRGESRFMMKSKEFGVEGDGFAKLTPAGRAEVARLLRSKLKLHYEELTLRLQGPESDWIVAEPEVSETAQEPTTPPEIAEVLFQELVPVWTNLGTAAARERTQLRLLRLAARVVIFKWEHERLPTRLEDAAPAEEIADPLTQDRFQYTPMSDRFRVFSKGVPATGEIDIKYVRGQGTGGPPPPR